MNIILCIHFLVKWWEGGVTVAKAPQVGTGKLAGETWKIWLGGWTDNGNNFFVLPTWRKPLLPHVKQTKVVLVTKSIDSVYVSLDKKTLNLLYNQITMTYIKPVKMW